jgi:hypothetical protein
MSKATHTGTCQCCGRNQKLPSGLLSIHGYTVDWGMFNGVCPGAKNLPFEQDISLIEKYIIMAGDKIVGLNEEIKDLKISVDSTSVWKQEGRVWIKREIILIDCETYIKFEWVYGEDEKKPRHRSMLGAASHSNTKTLDEAVKYENNRYVKKLERDVKQAEDYIVWQKGRIKDWKPSELTPIEKTHSGPKVHFIRTRSAHIEDGKIRFKRMQGAACNSRFTYTFGFSEFAKEMKDNPERCCTNCVKEYESLKARLKEVK